MSCKTFPILTVVRRSGLPVEDRGQRQVHINCPFCGDRRRRLYLYMDTDQYHCFHCRAHGNAASLYARRTGLTYKDAYHERLEDSVLHFPQPAVQRPPEREPAPLDRRDAVYRAMLGLLPLSAARQRRTHEIRVDVRRGQTVRDGSAELGACCRRPKPQGSDDHRRID